MNRIIKEDSISVNKSVVNTLLFFYFGFTADDPKDVILNKIIEKAYSDATMQGAFNTFLDCERMKSEAERIKGIVFKTIKKQLNVLAIDDYNIWHSSTCIMIKELYKGIINDDVIERFSYGNAQKLVNMTMKYLYMLSEIDAGYDEEVENLLEVVKEKKEFLHVPIDSYIIDAIWNVSDGYLPIRNDLDFKPKRGKKDYVQPSDLVKGWSTWNSDEYNTVRNDLSKFIADCNVCPLFWESVTWIEIAKRRRNK